MKKLVLLIALVLFATAAGSAQTNETLVPFQGSGYLYQFVKSSSPLIGTYMNPTASESGYSTGKGAFGTLNNTSSPPCPLNDASHVYTQWPSSRDVILRKHISLPAGAVNVKVQIALDAGAEIWFNGVKISGSSPVNSTACATENDPALQFPVPDNLVKAGDNVLAIRGIWINSKLYLDAKVTGDLTSTITATAGANGSISPFGTATVNAGTSQTYTITPNPGYHIANVIVDDTARGAVSSYTFTNIKAGSHTISASFAINTYTLTASAGANGSIAPVGVTTVNFGASQTYAITPSTGYHVANVLVDGISVGAVSSYTFSSISATHTISASFAINTYTITASAGAGGSITPNGAVAVNYGATPSFAIAPATGYHVADVLVDGASVGAVTSYTFPSVTGDHRISASFAINSYTLAPTAGANGSISPSTTVTVNYGGSQTFTINPNTGYHVADVLVDNVSAGAVTSYPFTNVTANHTISASFAINTYTIVATPGPNGSITPAGTTTVNYGATPTYTITPATGYHVVDVLVDGSSVGAVESYTFSAVTANRTISASFAINTYTLTASAGPNGSIAPNGLTSVTHGTNQTYTITPATGYHVADVLVDGVSVGMVTSYQFTNVTANHTISASFDINTYTLTASAGPNGSIAPSGVTTVTHGANQTYTITPNANYHIASIIVDGSAVPSPASSYTFTAVTANHIISASFAITTYTIDATAGSGGTITPSGAQTVNSGSDQTFTIAANPNYDITDVKVDGVSLGQKTTYTFSNVLANHTISASFAIKQFTITSTTGLNGSISPLGTTTVNAASDLTFTFTPNTGYHVSTVTIDGSPIASPGTSYTLTNILAAHTIDVQFAIDMYSLNATAANGTVAKDPDQAQYPYGTTVTLTGWAAEGYHFVSWDLGSGDIQTANPLTLKMDGTKNLTANFTANVPITVTVGTLNDAGLGSLREAITQVNSNAGPDTIRFGSTAAGTISLSTPLPILTDQTVVIGATDASGNPLTTVQPSPTFVANPLLPDGLEMSGIFLSYGYAPQQTTIKNLKITGFPGSGICISSNKNIVQGCVITGNGGDGICVEGGNNNLIGGTLAGQGNTIYSNQGNGVVVRMGDATVPPAGNLVLGNSIYANSRLGIDLGGDGITADRWNYPTAKPAQPTKINFAANYPLLAIATVAGSDPLAQPSIVQGSLYGWRNTRYRIELYLNDIASDSGVGEGKKLIASSDAIQTNGDGNVAFTLQSNIPLHGGEYISATATDIDPVSNLYQNTSEFSPDIMAGTITKIYGPTSFPSAANNRFVVNTTLSGVPLHWPDGKGSYRISSSIPPEFSPVVDPSFGTWNAVPGLPNGMHLGYANDGGPTSSNQWGGLPDGINNIVMISKADWEATTGAPAGAIAVTRVRYNSLTGEMTDVDIAFNRNFTFINGSQPGTKDFQDVMTHEIGHYGGLADIYSVGDPYYNLYMGPGPNSDVTMYGIVKDGDIFQRTVHADDQSGMAFIYSSVPRAHVDLTLIIDGSQSFANAGSFNGFNPSKNSAVELVDKLRIGDRVGIIKLPSTPGGPVYQFPPSGLQEISFNASTRQEVKDAITALVADPGDVRDIAAGLVAADAQLKAGDIAKFGKRAVILMSAGNETENPGALSTVTALRQDNVHVYTMGFDQSLEGQNLTSQLADTTGGAYYFAADTTVSKVVNQIWFNLAGYQLIGDSTMFSDALSWQGSNAYAISWQGALSWQGSASWALSWQGTNAYALSWQGAVDPGTSAILPALSWQGSKFHLALLPPDVNTAIVDANGDPIGSITPLNYTNYPGVEYINGPTYAYYKIPNPAPGIWKLFPVGANGINATLPDVPEPLITSMVAVTDVVMKITFDQSNYAMNDKVTVRVSLTEGGQVSGEHTVGGGPISGANVLATITIPGVAIPTQIPLVETGIGIYSATFTNTQAIGSYDFSVAATGTTPATHVPFVRHGDQSVYISSPPNASLFAMNSITLGDSTQVTSGTIIVNTQGRGTPTNNKVDLLVGNGVKTPARYNLKASRIALSDVSGIAGHFYYNTLQIPAGSSIPADRLTSPLTLNVTTQPQFDSPNLAKTARDTTIANGTTATLIPGSYGVVTISPKATVRLSSAGTYDFKRLWVRSNASLLFTGPTHLRIVQGYSGENGSYVGPAPQSIATAANIVLYVDGNDSQNGQFAKAVVIGPQASVEANVYAQNGTIWVNDNSVLRGGFFGKDITLGKKVSVALEPAFTSVYKAAGPEQTAAAEVPTTYALEQNYPNPFNPSTLIRYQLPESQDVSLAIYNVLGQEVKSLVSDAQIAGHYVMQWDGTNNQGARVASGMYIYRLKAGTFVESRKMMLLK